MEIPESIKKSAYEVLTPEKLRKYSKIFLESMLVDLRETIQSLKPSEGKEKMFYSKEIKKISNELKTRGA